MIFHQPTSPIGVLVPTKQLLIGIKNRNMVTENHWRTKSFTPFEVYNYVSGIEYLYCDMLSYRYLD